jgi:cytochrome c peroxidase
MRISPVVAALVLLAGHAVSSHAGDGILNLTSLANYANQPIPIYINRSNTPANNPITDKGATLGRVLFYDKRLSLNNTISCASCHRQSHAFSDDATASTGVAGTTGRHAMRLVNARFANEVRFFWDERATSLENQTTQPIQNHIEMGFSGASGDLNFAALVNRLSAIDTYRALFTVVFGDATITEARVQLVLAQFVRSIQSFDSRFDTGRAQVGDDNPPFPNFTQVENAGKQLFLAPPPSGAGCAGCHAPPEFDIDPASRNNGVITQIGGGTDLTNTRAPSLRDLLGPGGQPNGGFMHDASFTTLARVIDHYNAIPGDNTNLDPRLRRPGGGTQNLNLSQPQKDSIVAFLATLTGTALYTDAKWSDPFDAQGQLSLIVLPADAITIENLGNGTARVACKAAPGLQYQLRSSPDLATWTTIATVTASASGVCEQIVTLGGTVYFRYAYQPASATPAIARVAASLPVVTAVPARSRVVTALAKRRR